MYRAAGDCNRRAIGHKELGLISPPPPHTSLAFPMHEILLSISMNWSLHSIVIEIRFMGLHGVEPECAGNSVLCHANAHDVLIFSASGKSIFFYLYILSSSAPTLRSWVRIPLRHGCLCVFCVRFFCFYIVSSEIASRPIKRLMRTYHWISLFMSYTKSAN
jgi:hypothetical protein